MKIGIKASTLDKTGCGRWNENTYKKLNALGFDCTDFNMCDTDSVLYCKTMAAAAEILQKEKELAREAGIEISQVHGPWRWPVKDDTPEDRQERMEKMKKSLYLTSVLGCQNWVVHPIMPFGVFDMETNEAQKTWEMNLQFFKDLLPTAKEYGITVCLENMPMRRFSIATPEAILRFVSEINDEHFRICFDTGHVAVFETLSAAKEVKRLGEKIKVLHVHDNRCGADLHLPPYFGDTDWKSFARALKEIRFTGSFSLETVPPPHLPDDIFESTCLLFAQIAKDVIKE